MEDAIDIDAIPQEAADNLVHLKKLGPMAEGFISEVNELLDVLNHSVEQAGDTERKIEEIYGEIHFAREQIVAAQKVEEEAIEAKKGLEMSIEQARKKGEEHRAAEAKKEEVADLYKKIEQLKVDVQAGSGWRPDQVRGRKRTPQPCARPATIHLPHSPAGPTFRSGPRSGRSPRSLTGPSMCTGGGTSSPRTRPASR